MVLILCFHCMCNISCLLVCSPTSSLMLSPEGLVIIPSTAPAFLILDFLKENTGKARELKCNYERWDMSQVTCSYLLTNQYLFIQKSTRIMSIFWFLNLISWWQIGGYISHMTWIRQLCVTIIPCLWEHYITRVPFIKGDILTIIWNLVTLTVS